MIFFAKTFHNPHNILEFCWPSWRARV